MTQKQQIVEFMKGKESVKLDDLYCIPDIKRENIRSILNQGVKHQDTFERVKKGVYKLKQ